MMTTILFADDKKSIRQFCKQQLEEEDGYRVILARDGEEAIDLVQRELPDVVILDLCMVGMGGLDAVEPIKAIAPEIPVILFTASDEDCLRDRRSRLAMACVKKSEDLTELRRAIVRALALREENEASRPGLETIQPAPRRVRLSIPQSDVHETATFTSTAPIMVNAAFLQEIKEDNIELRQMLAKIRGALATPGPSGGQWKRFVELLGELRDGLAMCFGLEETYGYFENPVSVAPRLSRNAQTLRTQHQHLYSELCAIFEQAEQRLYREARAIAPRRIVRRFIAFCLQLQEHEARENDLIFRTFTEGVSERGPGQLSAKSRATAACRTRMLTPGLPRGDND
jgi:CheY-like chemotaxis protein